MLCQVYKWENVSLLLFRPSSWRLSAAGSAQPRDPSWKIRYVCLALLPSVTDLLPVLSRLNEWMQIAACLILFEKTDPEFLTEPTEPGPLGKWFRETRTESLLFYVEWRKDSVVWFPDCREEQYLCTRLYSVHKPCKQCLNSLCFYR